MVDKQLTDSAPDTTEVTDSSFFCFGLAFAKELNMLFFSFFGAVRSAGLGDCGLSSRLDVSIDCDGCLESASSLFLSPLLCVGSSFCRGRLAGTVALAGAGFAGPGA